ncbi:MAG: hypothetical protein IPL96_07835 [Holophagaceae bacterium]|nr:hypothetical protein [Holophagaceae bacterium]
MLLLFVGCGGGGNGGSSASLAPKSPTAFTATVDEPGNFIDLAWTPPTPPYDGLFLEGRTNGATFQSLHESKLPAGTIGGRLTYSQAPPELTAFDFRLKAANGVSASPWVETSALWPVRTAQNFKASSSIVSYKPVSLSWSHNSVVATKALLERRPSQAGEWSSLVELPLEAREYTDLPVLDGTYYDYRISLVAADGHRSSSYVGSVGVGLKRATSLTATQSGPALDLSWNPESQAAVSQQILAEDPRSQAGIIATLPPGARGLRLSPPPALQTEYRVISVSGPATIFNVDSVPYLHVPPVVPTLFPMDQTRITTGKALSMDRAPDGSLWWVQVHEDYTKTLHHQDASGQTAYVLPVFVNEKLLLRVDPSGTPHVFGALRDTAHALIHAQVENSTVVTQIINNFDAFDSMVCTGPNQFSGIVRLGSSLDREALQYLVTLDGPSIAFSNLPGSDGSRLTEASLTADQAGVLHLLGWSSPYGGAVHASRPSGGNWTTEHMPKGILFDKLFYKGSEIHSVSLKFNEASPPGWSVVYNHRLSGVWQPEQVLWAPAASGLAYFRSFFDSMNNRIMLIAYPFQPTPSRLILGGGSHWQEQDLPIYPADAWGGVSTAGRFWLAMQPESVSSATSSLPVTLLTER